MSEPVVIELCPRLEKGKVHAQIKDKPGVWAHGDGIDDAIGNLVRYHTEYFNVVIDYPEKVR